MEAATAASTTGAGRFRRRHHLRRDEHVPHGRPVRRRAPGPHRLHRTADLLPVPQAAQPRTGCRSRDYLWRGTPTGSGARAPSACSSRWCAGCGRAGGMRSDVYRRLVALDRRHRARPGRPAARASRARSPSSRTSRSRWSGSPSSWSVPPRGRHRAGVDVPDAAGRRAHAGRSTRWSRESCTSTSASGRRSPVRRASPTGTQPLIERRGRRLGGHKSLYSTVHSTTEASSGSGTRDAYRRSRTGYDPNGRLPDLYDKCDRMKGGRCRSQHPSPAVVGDGPHRYA